MIWTNKGLKRRITELEAEVTSLKLLVKESKNKEEHIVGIANLQHGLITDLQAKVEELSKTPSEPVDIPVKPGVTTYSLGRRLAQSLKRVTV